LAGGVVMGAGADLLHKGYVAYIVGLGTGVISSALFSYSPILLRKMNIYDVAGVFNLHAIPGLLGGLLSAIFRAAYIDNRGGIQVAGTFISIGIGLIGGLLCGVVIRWFGFFHIENDFFNDKETVHLEVDLQQNLAHYGSTSFGRAVLRHSATINDVKQFREEKLADMGISPEKNPKSKQPKEEQFVDFNLLTQEAQRITTD